MIDHSRDGMKVSIFNSGTRKSSSPGTREFFTTHTWRTQEIALRELCGSLGIQQRSEMQSNIPYRNCLIHIESFQLTHSSGWIPRFTLTRQDDVPSGRDRLDKVFLSKDAADEFALEDAMQWIDQN
jgi:hypothetical protein